jgi:tetratricopeptide (TPR) repeat protein
MWHYLLDQKIITGIISFVLILVFIVIGIQFRVIWILRVVFFLKIFWGKLAKEGKISIIIALGEAYQQRAEKRSQRQSYRALNDIEKSISYFNTGLEKSHSPKLNTGLINAYYTRANINIELKKWKAVCPDLNVILDRQPEEKNEDRFVNIVIKIQDNDLDGIIKILRSCIFEFPINATLADVFIEILIRHQNIAFKNGNWAEVIKDCDDLIRLSINVDEGCYNYYLDRATAKRQVGDYKSSIDDANIVLLNSLKRILSNDQDSIDDTNVILSSSFQKDLAYICRGWDNIRLNKFLAAESDFTVVINNDPQMKNINHAYEGRGAARLRSMNYKSAVEDYDMLIDNLGYDKVPYYYEERGEALYTLKQYDKTIKDFSYALELNNINKNIRTLYLRGDTYRLRGDPEDLEYAIKDFNEVITIDPEYFYPFNGLGLVYVQKSNGISDERSTEKIELLKQAREKFRVAINIIEKRDKKFTESYRNLAYVESKLHNHNEADRLLETAIKIEQENQMTVKYQPSFFYLWQELEVIFSNPNVTDHLQKTIEEFTYQIGQDPNAIYGAGLLSIKKGDKVKAIEYLNKYIGLNKEHGEAYFWRAYARGLNENWLGAIDDCNTAIKYNYMLSQVYWLRGFSYNKNNELGEAIKDFSKAIEYSPKYIEAHRDLVVTLAQKEEWGKVIEKSNKAIELGIRNEIIYTMRAEAYRMTANLEKSIEDSTEALNIDPKYVLANRIRGLALLELLKSDEAIKDFDIAIEIDPIDAIAYCGRGASLRLKGKFEEAKRDLDKVLEFSPGNAMALYNRGWLYIQMWNKTKNDLFLNNAAHDFEQEIDLEQKKPDGYCGLGEVYRLKGKLDEALSQIMKAILQNPGFYLAYQIRGWVYYQKGEWDEALRNFSKILDMSNLKIIDKYTIYYGRAECNRMKKEWDAAIRDQTDAITLNPEFASAYHYRGLVFSQKKDWENAIADYTNAIKLINPNDTEYVNIFVDRAWAYYQKGLDVNALEDINNAIHLNNRSTDAYNTWGIMLLYNKELDKAVSKFSRAIELDHKSYIGYENRGIAKCYNDKFEEAINDLNKAIEINDKNANCYYNRAWVKIKNKNYIEALKDCENAKKLNLPDSGGYGTSSLANWWNDKTEEAISDLEKILEIQLEKFTLETPKRAREDSIIWGSDSQEWIHAIEKKPKDSVAYLGRAISQWIAGKLDSAIEDLNHAIDLNNSLTKFQNILDLMKAERNKRSIGQGDR